MRALTLLAVAVLATPLLADAWPQFRGPAGSGHAPGTSPPAEWAKGKNVAWTADLPGVGWSSPVVHGDRVFVTTAVTDKQPKAKGFGEGAGDFSSMLPWGKKAPDEEYRWLVLALDRKTGKPLWQIEAVRRKPGMPIHPSNTYATESPATDGERVYAYFGPVGVVCCLDRDGKELWRKELGVGPMSASFGSGSSPALADGRLYVQHDNEKQSFLVAFDAATGKELWRADRDSKTSWSTPLVWRNKARTEVVACGSKGVAGYDPATGKELWRFGGVPSTFSASPAADDERVYFGTSSPMTPGTLYAVNAGATGDVTLKGDETASKSVAWSAKGQGPGLPSPVVHDGRLYLVPSGVLSCYDAKTGERVYRSRLPLAKNITASPLVVDGKVYVLAEDGEMYVAEAGAKFNLLGRNKIEGLYWATPAIAGGELYLRAADRLYCVRR